MHPQPRIPKGMKGLMGHTTWQTQGQTTKKPYLQRGGRIHTMSSDLQAANCGTQTAILTHVNTHKVPTAKKLPSIISFSDVSYLQLVKKEKKRMNKK